MKEQTFCYSGTRRKNAHSPTESAWRIFMIDRFQIQRIFYRSNRVCNNLFVPMPRLVPRWNWWGTKYRLRLFHRHRCNRRLFQFQFTLPWGSDTCITLTTVSVWRVSIHAPVRERHAERLARCSADQFQFTLIWRAEVRHIFFIMLLGKCRQAGYRQEACGYRQGARKHGKPTARTAFYHPAYFSPMP